MRIQSQKGAGILDTLLVCILVSILIGIVIPYHYRMTQKAKETALQVGLNQIRKGVELHYVLQGRFPKNLKSLIHARYVVPVRDDTFFSGEYLRAQVVDQQGNLLDPFGNQYRYNPNSGAVVSETEGYEHW